MIVERRIVPPQVFVYFRDVGVELLVEGDRSVIVTVRRRDDGELRQAGPPDEGVPGARARRMARRAQEREFGWSGGVGDPRDGLRGAFL